MFAIRQHHSCEHSSEQALEKPSCEPSTLAEPDTGLQPSEQWMRFQGTAGYRTLERAYIGKGQYRFQQVAKFRLRTVSVRLTLLKTPQVIAASVCLPGEPH